MIERLWSAGGTLLVSAVSAWEIGTLVEKGRIALDVTPDAWLRDILRQPGVVGLPLDPMTALGGSGLAEFTRQDPMDRLLIAAAISQDCPLVTHDAHILAFAQRYGGRYGFAAINE